MRRVVVSVVVAGVVVVRDRNRIDRNNYLRQENWGAKGGKRPKAIKKEKSVVAGQSGCLMLNSKRARAQGATVRGEDEKRWIELNVLSE